MKKKSTLKICAPLVPIYLNLKEYFTWDESYQPLPLEMEEIHRRKKTESQT